MRPLIFAMPDNCMDSGGALAQVRFMELCSTFRQVLTAYYNDRVEGALHLDDALKTPEILSQNPIFVIHWGPDIRHLLQRLAGHDVIYFAHSVGWGNELPPSVPIICVSKNTMAFWGRNAPSSYITYIPNVVNFSEGDATFVRDIDVLIQKRKSSQYLLHELLPALEGHCKVTVLDEWVDDLSTLFRRSKVYLYDSVEHWLEKQVTEGFGLPPLEAMAQGCVVFSSVNDALADYLEPSFNCHKLRVHSVEWDAARILKAVSDQEPRQLDTQWFETYSNAHVTMRLKVVLSELHAFFDHAHQHTSNIDDLKSLRVPTTFSRVKRKLRRALMSS